MGLLAKANRMKYDGYEMVATPEENGKVNVWVSFKKLGNQDFIIDGVKFVKKLEKFINDTYKQGVKAAKK